MGRAEVKIPSRDFTEIVRFRARELDASISLPSRAFDKQLRLRSRALRLNSRVLTASNPLVRLYGHSFASLVPVMVTLPVATPGLTTCNITWETNIPAYHRLRFKKAGDPSWTVTAWTLTPSTIASIDLSGLESKYTRYTFDVQSCAVGDGSAAFDYYPGDNSAWFCTTWTSPLLYSDFSVSKGFLGELSVRWKTNVNADDNEMRLKGASGNWDYYGPIPDSDTDHRITDMGFRWDAGSYYYQVRNKNMCGYQQDWSAEHGFTVDGNGEIQSQW